MRNVSGSRISLHMNFRGPYWFLSNFYPAPIVLNDVRYPTAEHAFVAAKCTRASDRELVLVQPTPALAKKLGHVLSTRSNWDAIKVGVMRTILDAKFEQHFWLRKKLVATTGTPLIEHNAWHDTFWGCCTCDLHQGAGQNHLGQLLEAIREEA